MEPHITKWISSQINNRPQPSDRITDMLNQSSLRCPFLLVPLLAFATRCSASDVLEKQKTERLVTLAKSVGNALVLGFLSPIERVSPAAAVGILENWRKCDSSCVEPFVPAVTTLLQSNNRRVRWSAVRFLISSRNEIVIDPILNGLRKEDCMYVIDASLEVFLCFENNAKLVRGVEILLGKPLTVAEAPQVHSCTDANAHLFDWPGDYPISVFITGRITRAVARIGPKALPVLKARLRDPKQDQTTKYVCACAVRTVFEKMRRDKSPDKRKLGEDILPALVRSLSIEDKFFQMAVIDAIEEAATATRKRVPELQDFVNDEKNQLTVRDIARQALTRIDEEIRKAEPLLR